MMDDSSTERVSKHVDGCPEAVTVNKCRLQIKTFDAV